MTAKLCLDCRDVVGESLVWSAEDQALYWVDIGGRRIHRFAPATGAHESGRRPILRPRSVCAQRAASSSD